MEMKPRSAPEKGAFVPPSRSRMAGTEPAPTKTSRAVPTASANRRCAAEKDSITDLLPARGGGGREPSPRIPRASSLGNDIRHYRTPFGERTASHMSCQGTRTNLVRHANQVRVLEHVGGAPPPSRRSCPPRQSRLRQPRSSPIGTRRSA